MYAFGLLLIDENFGFLQLGIFNLSCGCIFNLSWGWLFNMMTWCYLFICVIDSHTTGRGVKGNCTVRLDILTRDNNPAQPADPLFREIPYVSLLVPVWNCAVYVSWLCSVLQSILYTPELNGKGLLLFAKSIACNVKNSLYCSAHNLFCCVCHI